MHTQAEIGGLQQEFETRLMARREVLQEEIGEALRTIEQLGAPRLAALIVSSLEIPALPGVDPEEVAARRHAELLEQWNGVCSWFLDRDAAAGLRSAAA